MGYTTSFTGQVTITPALNPHEIHYLEKFSTTRHLHRTSGPYVVTAERDHDTDQESDVVITNGRSGPPPEQPGYWCQWIPTGNGSALVWDEEEKFYDADLWMAYLIGTFLAPDADLARELAEPVPGRVYPEEFAHFTFDHRVHGVIGAEGEEPDDLWRLEVRDNVVYVIRHQVEPEYADVDPADPGDWTDEQWARYAARIRRNVAFVVRAGQCAEVDPASGLVFAPVRPSD